MTINYHLEPNHFKQLLDKFWDTSGIKLKLITQNINKKRGIPVFTENGKYTTQEWTDWTQGFVWGSMILQFEATIDNWFLDFGKQAILKYMGTHLTDTGVHDHGFQTISTFGNLWKLMREGLMPEEEWESRFYELAVKVSGAIQAKRWTSLPNGGFIYSFNGPHSLFVDTIRSLRILVLSHELGHYLIGENGCEINLLQRAVQHGMATAKYSVYYGNGRDRFDRRGRTAHESIFNINNGSYRSPNSQQGYSAFSTWTRGLSWAILGFAEQLEYLETKKDVLDLEEVISDYEEAAEATADFYIENTPSDGVPYWDTGDPSLQKLGDYLSKPSDPFNGLVPVDSSAAAIAAQGLFRLAKYLRRTSTELSNKYFHAAMTVSAAILNAPYLCEKENHEGLLLHAVYHYPKGWDYQPKGSKIPYGEATMWGDYHIRELAVYLKRIVEGKPYHCFFGPTNI